MRFNWRRRRRRKGSRKKENGEEGGAEADVEIKYDTEESECLCLTVVCSKISDGGGGCVTGIAALARVDVTPSPTACRTEHIDSRQDH